MFFFIKLKIIYNILKTIQFNSQQRGVPIVYGGEDRVQISSLKIIIYSIR